MARARSSDPVQTFKYKVTLSNIIGNEVLGTFVSTIGAGVAVLGFNKVSGLGVERAELKFGTGDGVEKKIPGRRTIKDITMERGMVRDGKKNLTYILPWVGLTNDIFRQDGFRFDMTVQLMASVLETENPIATWSYTDCWIKSYDGPDLDAEADVLAIEKIVVVAEEVKIDSFTV